MDSDDDDMPLTFRRTSQTSAQEKPRPKPAAPQAPPSRNPGPPPQQRPAERPKQPGGPRVPEASAREDDVPLSRRVVNGAVKRPPQSAPASSTANGQQQKKPRLEPAVATPDRQPAPVKTSPQGQPRPSPQGQPQAVGPKLPKTEPGTVPRSTPPSAQRQDAVRNASPNASASASASARASASPSGSGRPGSAGNGAQASKQRPAPKEEEEDDEEGDEEDDDDEDEGDEEDEDAEEEDDGDEEGDEEDSEEDDVPLAQRAGAAPPKKSRAESTAAAKKKPEKPGSRSRGGSSGTGKKKEDNSVKWTTLAHNGVIFPPSYTPHGIKILYNKKPVELTPDQEEVATMFAVMRETEYYTKPKFLANFWEDWRKILGPRHAIQKLDLCDFTPIWEWHCQEKEKKKQMTTEEKKRIKEEKMKVEEKYMWAVIDGVKEKVGNFRVEPPGLFRGRGEHPKMGKLKRRITPEDITINLSKDAPVPECPIPGHRWREVRHDNTVTWLAYWADPINPKEFKYVFLAASSRLKGLSDKEKYEKARKLKDHIDKIRATYTKQFKSGDETARQIAVATYLIDRLALRAGNEKDDDEADTVGCCSLKVEHVTRVPPNKLQFDFLGKDSIRYFNTVEVLPDVYAAIGDFQKRKKPDDDLFNRLDTSKLNAHLKEIMPGLTAKVFRTYNASITLDTLLQDTVGADAKEKVADYQRANKEVAILCNHQRSVSKAHASQMEKLQTKVADLETTIEELEEDMICIKKGRPLKQRPGKEPPSKTPSAETLQKKIAQAKGRLDKMKLDMTIKDELKTVALGTSKINYMDPRITVAWCKRHDVPIEKVFNKSLLAKFAWAMDVEPDYRF